MSMRIWSLPLTCVLLAGGLCGCAGAGATGTRFLSFVGVQQKPVAIALVVDSGSQATLAALNPFPEYGALRRALQDTLDRPVTIEPCFAFQAASGLESEWFNLAFVTAAQYAGFAHADQLHVLAIATGNDGATAESAVLIVRANSAFQDVAQLRNQVVAFGPEYDTLTHVAALQLLREHGLEKTDLSLELLPIPGALKHFANARSVAQSVANNSSAAGFVAASAFADMPLHSSDASIPGQDEFRVIAATQAYPRGLVIASPKLSAADAAKIRHALLQLAQTNPAALEPMGVTGYTLPPEDLITRCRTLTEAASTTAPAEAAPQE